MNIGKFGQQSSKAYAPQNVVSITTDESMQHTFLAEN